MTTLLASLSSRAHGGRVAEDDFLAATASLRLDAEGLKRLEVALTQQGLIVERAKASTRESVRISRVLGLARKYVAAGVVPAPAFAGLVSLCGLDTAERESLAEALRGEGVAISAIPIPRTKEVSETSGENGPDEKPAVEEFGEKGEVLTDLDAAITAARSRMNEDRFRHTAWKTLLSAEQEVGLSVLLKGGPEHIDHKPGRPSSRPSPSPTSAAAPTRPWSCTTSASCTDWPSVCRDRASTTRIWCSTA
jgi:RNA polymerase primary sigma factor